MIDASMWISLLLPHDVNNSLATSWLAQHSQSGGLLVAPSLLPVEVAGALSRITGHTQSAYEAANQLYQLPVVRIVHLDQVLINEAMRIAADHALRGADSIYVALAKKEGIPLVTFDKEQLTRPAAIIPTIRP
ncbi:MAG: type II toxin-antitoxin system VapC family toxin [Chloroflexota bacterium]|nr:type II toxin-antitoxin system VapC family toxin [Chloroflexota bacterium]